MCEKNFSVNMNKIFSLLSVKGLNNLMICYFIEKKVLIMTFCEFVDRH
jgi:hypothetical protein